MNVNDVIRPWILACGQYWGLEAAEEYRWPDALSRPEVIYATYRTVYAEPMPRSKIRRVASATGSYDVTYTGIQHWLVVVQVDLYNSQNGLAELAGACIAAQADQDIRDLQAAHGAAFNQCRKITDESTLDDNRIRYHHRALVDLYSWEGYEHIKTNDRITAVDADTAVTIGEPDEN